jgi:hypothetical protein
MIRIMGLSNEVGQIESVRSRKQPTFFGIASLELSLLIKLAERSIYDSSLNSTRTIRVPLFAEVIFDATDDFSFLRRGGIRPACKSYR